MARIYYVECPNCKKEYYIDDILIQPEAEQVKMKCPYCKKIFLKNKPEILKKK